MPYKDMAVLFRAFNFGSSKAHTHLQVSFVLYSAAHCVCVCVCQQAVRVSTAVVHSDASPAYSMID